MNRFMFGRTRKFPSPCSVHVWLALSHDEALGQTRVNGQAYIPPPSAKQLAARHIHTVLIHR